MEEVELAEKLADLVNRSRSNTKRLDRLEARQDALEKLATSVEVLATKQEQTDKDIREIKADVKTLVEKPGRRWERIVDKIILAIVGALIVALLIRLGIPM